MRVRAPMAFPRVCSRLFTRIGEKVAVPNMPNAPLRYTLMVARFPPIINIANHVGAFQEAIRHDYPLLDPHMNQGLNVSVSPDGAKFEWLNEPMWQFADAERGHALILGSDLLVLHAGPAYKTHADFIARFLKATAALRDAPGLGIKHVQGLGYRYVDLVVPRADRGEQLSQYIEPWALPTYVPDLSKDGLRLAESAHVVAFKTELGVVRLQSLRTPPVTLPPDLGSLLVQKNGWIPERPDGDFAILDIDHSSAFDRAHDLEPQALAHVFSSLRASARTIFERATTTYAMHVWEGEP